MITISSSGSVINFNSRQSLSTSLSVNRREEITVVVIPRLACSATGLFDTIQLEEELIGFSEEDLMLYNFTKKKSYHKKNPIATSFLGKNRRIRNIFM